MADLSVREFERMINGQHDNKHAWNDEGEKCLKCGDSDWMNDPVCSNSKIKAYKGHPMTNEATDEQKAFLDWPEIVACDAGNYWILVCGESTIADNMDEIGAKTIEAGMMYYRNALTRDNSEAINTRAAPSSDVAYRGLCEIREIYCNMEGFIPETAAEAYVLQEIKKMYDCAVEHIALTQKPSVE